MTTPYYKQEMSARHRLENTEANINFLKRQMEEELETLQAIRIMGINNAPKDVIARADSMYKKISNILKQI